jgi:hypothetical protein
MNLYILLQLFFRKVIKNEIIFESCCLENNKEKHVAEIWC